MPHFSDSALSLLLLLTSYHTSWIFQTVNHLLFMKWMCACSYFFIVLHRFQKVSHNGLSWKWFSNSNQKKGGKMKKDTWAVKSSIVCEQRANLSFGHYPIDDDDDDNDDDDDDDNDDDDDDTSCIHPLEMPFNHLTCICQALLWEWEATAPKKLNRF